MQLASDDLAKLIARRHPEYEKSLVHWNFLELCYSGDRSWFDTNIFRYIKEGPVEFKDRLSRAYRFNHSREIVDLVGKYIFKSKIYRNDLNAPEEIIQFWKETNRSGSSPVQKFIRQVAKLSSIFGRVWIVVDNNRAGNTENPREYAYVVKPQHVLDMSYDENDQLNWILIMESARDDEDPITSTGKIKTRYRLWTKEDWYLIESNKDDTQRNEVISIVDYGNHNLGVVPIFSHDHNDCEELYTSPSLICDIAYLDRACANYLSNLDAIIQDQTFSQLAMPAQNLMPGEDAYIKMVETGTKRIFCFDGDGGAAPFFLSPDVKQAELIITAIGKVINEIYHTVGLSGERTKDDNSIGIDNSSGVAKAFDFERVNALLSTKAASLKRAEVKMMELVLLWNGTKYLEPLEDLIVYPETFDIRGIADELLVAQNLMLIEAPMEIRREQMRNIIPKVFPNVSDSVKEKMLKEIDDMEDPMNMLSQGGVSGKVTPSPSFKGNVQGEANTGNTIADKSNF